MRNLVLRHDYNNDVDEFERFSRRHFWTSSLRIVFAENIRLACLGDTTVVTIYNNGDDVDRPVCVGSTTTASHADAVI